MKCALCNQRNGNTRCEGCNTLFCLPCMTKHHDELVQQFQLLLDMRNEVKQSLNIYASTSSDGKEMACINEIDKWERESIQRIQHIAAKVRENAKEITTKHMDKISRQFEKLSIDIQERQKQGDYLENDLEKIKTQLDQLKNDIEQVNEKIQVDSTMSDNIEWDALIYIVEKETPTKTTSESVQTKDTVTSENKKTASLSKFIKDHRTSNSSSVTRQTEQVTTSRYIFHIIQIDIV